MVYTLTLNPALDYVMDVNDIEFGATNRSGNESFSFGGKGINVSVVLSRLGISSVALGFVAGFTGERLIKELENQGIETDFVKLGSGNTRVNVKLRSQGEITEINAAGPEISDLDMQKLFSKLDVIKENDYLVLAGSVPGGLGNVYAEIMQKLQGRGINFVLDTTGEQLLSALRYKPCLIKPNRDELEQLLDICISTDEQIIQSAQKLKNMGAKNVLVSLGESGAVLLDGEGRIHKSHSHKITPENTVGAGDSMVAGFIAGQVKGYEFALKLGIAAGAATAASKTLATKSEILKLMDE